MLAMAKSVEDKNFWTELKQLYMKHLCLLKIKSNEYFDRNKKAAVYDILATKLKEGDGCNKRHSVNQQVVQHFQERIQESNKVTGVCGQH